MDDKSSLIRTVAIVQAAPVYLDTKASLDKLIGLISDAAAQGAQLVACGETWLPGYPAWLDYSPYAASWNFSPTKAVFARLRQQSIQVPGAETETLCKLARAKKIVITIGVNEKITSGIGSGTLYNTFLIINEEGELKIHHRKLVPTYSERMVWGNGDGYDLKATQTAAGRVGGLICWEHWMPLARQAMHNSGEQIHIALWPTAHGIHQLASRHYAFEGRCFVLAAGSILRAGDLPGEFEFPEELLNNKEELVMSGGSSIIAPDASYVVEPVADEEKVIVADIDLTLIDREVMTLDTGGHYSRPDLFHFQVDDRRRD